MSTFAEVLDFAEQIYAAKEEYKYELAEFNKRAGAYESEREEFAHGGEPTSSEYERLTREYEDLNETRELLNVMHDEITRDIEQYQELRKGIEQ